MKTTLSEVLRYYCVTIQDKWNGSVDVYTEDGFFGTYSKKYTQKVCRVTRHDFKKLYKR